jgi:sec-independent protein translocase protein TatC
VENTFLESPKIKAAIEGSSSFLVEAKKRLIITLCVFAGATFIGFFFYEKIIKFLIDLLSLKGINIVFTSPFQFINLAISCGIAVGLIISFPLLVAQILFFLKPALRKKEYKMLITFLPFSLLLFLTGLIFGFLIMKWQIKIFLDRSLALGIGNILDISRLLTTVVMTSVLMGIGFEFPILLILLLRLGLVKRQQLTKIRPWVYLGSFIFAMLLPPDSVLADILLTLPLIILFELTLILSRFQKEKLSL